MIKFINPINDRIVVKRDDAELATPAGIILPEQARQKPYRGVVVAVGPGKRLNSGGRGEMVLRPGDHVLFTSYAGTEVEVGTVKLMVMQEDDVLCVVP